MEMMLPVYRTVQARIMVTTIHASLAMFMLHAQMVFCMTTDPVQPIWYGMITKRDVNTHLPLVMGVEMMVPVYQTVKVCRMVTINHVWDVMCMLLAAMNCCMTIDHVLQT